MRLNVNGKLYEVEVPGDVPLLWVLREELQLTGTKFGCGQALCGACTVHVDGKARRSCVTAVADVAGKAIRTIEGLAEGNTLHPVQQAWEQENVPQCGFCQSGQIMSAVALLNKTPRPNDAQIDAVMSANLCRCGIYPRIRRAIHRAADLAAAGSPAGASLAPPSKPDAAAQAGSAGGSAQGGSAQGGSAQGGSAQGGSAQGGSAQDASGQGGSAQAGVPQ